MDTYASLVKPDASHIAQIEQFRLEMLQEKSVIAGCGPLERMPDISEWLDFNHRREQKEYVPEDFVTAEQFVYIRESDQKIVGMIQLRHELTERLRKFAGTLVIQSVRASAKKDTRNRCWRLVLKSVKNKA